MTKTSPIARILAAVALLGAIALVFVVLSSATGTDDNGGKGGGYTLAHEWGHYFYSMYDEYLDAIKGDMAEVRNSGGRGGGVATSAKFIEHFTEGYPWAHLDIASTAWSTSEREPVNPKGATGYGVRLLVEYVAAA